LEQRNEISQDIFLPQAIPAYAANRIFEMLERNYSDYSYREVATNPRNLDDLPTEWEVDVIRYYKNNPNVTKKIHTRKVNNKDFLYISSPIKITEPKCLKCHTDAQTAPVSLVKNYGGVNGMGWKMNDIIGAHFVSLPVSLPEQKAKASLFNMLISMISIFTLIFMAINFMLVKWVVEPLAKIAEITEQISLKKSQIENFPKVGNKEMTNLIISIERLRESLKKSIQKMIKNESNE